MHRDPVPAAIKRAVLVEAGHRCAIPTCRSATTEIAHVVPWSESQDNSFENLIALCPNCHTRYDQRKEIDRLSMVMYKHNLGIVNNRYGEFERRLFQLLAQTGDRIFVVGPGGDLLVANAIKDGFFEDKQVKGMDLEITGSNGFQRSFPMTFTYWVTDKGVAFIKRYATGQDVA